MFKGMAAIMNFAWEGHLIGIVFWAAMITSDYQLAILTLTITITITTACVNGQSCPPDTDMYSVCQKEPNNLSIEFTMLMFLLK